MGEGGKSSVEQSRGVQLHCGYDVRASANALRSRCANAPFHFHKLHTLKDRTERLAPPQVSVVNPRPPPVIWTVNPRDGLRSSRHAEPPGPLSATVSQIQPLQCVLSASSRRVNIYHTATPGILMSSDGER